MKTVNGRKCRSMVQNRVELKSHGAIYARSIGSKGYAVFSYGEHWPLHVWDGVNWNHNLDKYSVTTSKHYGATHPHDSEGFMLDCAAMRELVDSLDRQAAEEMRAERLAREVSHA
jgi:hypothetical protein